VPTTMPSRAPPNSAAPAPVPNSQNERLRSRNAAPVSTSASARFSAICARTRSISAPGASRTRK